MVQLSDTDEFHHVLDDLNGAKLGTRSVRVIDAKECRNAVLCLNCHRRGHFITECPHEMVLSETNSTVATPPSQSVSHLSISRLSSVCMSSPHRKAISRGIIPFEPDDLKSPKTVITERTISELVLDHQDSALSALQRYQQENCSKYQLSIDLADGTMGILNSGSDDDDEHSDECDESQGTHPQHSHHTITISEMNISENISDRPSDQQSNEHSNESHDNQTDKEEPVNPINPHLITSPVLSPALTAASSPTMTFVAPSESAVGLSLNTISTKNPGTPQLDHILLRNQQNTLEKMEHLSF